jgi:hypothetical protein
MALDGRIKVVLSILGKTFLYITVIAVTFALVLLAWEKYDWLPFVKNIVRGLVIPCLLGGLVVLLLHHEVSFLKDDWKKAVRSVTFFTGTLVIVNAGIIAQEVFAKVIKADSITSLSNEEIKSADYLQIQSVEPDTGAYNYLFEKENRHIRRAFRRVYFYLYQVCPLKNKQGVFICTRTKEKHLNKKEKLEQWKTDFINRENGSIKRDATSAHLFKVLHQRDRYEQYQATAATCATRYGAISPEHMILLEIRQPDSIKRWEDNALYIFLSLLVGFSWNAIMLLAVLYGKTE